MGWDKQRTQECGQKVRESEGRSQLRLRCSSEAGAMTREQRIQEAERRKCFLEEGLRCVAFSQAG